MPANANSGKCVRGFVQFVVRRALLGFLFVSLNLPSIARERRSDCLKIVDYLNLVEIDRTDPLGLSKE